MKIRRKFIVMIGIPLFAILMIFVIGFISFSSITSTVEYLNTLQNDRATMIDSDRDAYQAYLSETMAAQSLDEEEVLNQKASHDGKGGRHAYKTCS
jgi:methyl-accepting chemotaxis protein